MWNKIGVNSFYIYVSRLGIQALLAIFVILVARRLGGSILGEYSLIFSLLTIANIATTFGTDMIVIRKVSTERNVNVAFGALVLQLSLSLIVITVALILPARTLGLPADVIASMRVLSFALIPMSVVSVMSALLRARERMRPYAVLGLGTALIQVLLFFLLVGLNGSLMQLVQVLLLTQALSALTFLATALSDLKEIHVIPREWLSISLQLLKLTGPVAVLGFLGILFSRTEIFALTFMLGPLETGWYSAASRIAYAPRFINFSIMTALLPAMSNAFQLKPSNERRKLFRSYLSGLLGLAAFVAIVFSFFAGPIIKLLFGTEFDVSIGLLRILAWALIPFTISNYLSIKLFAAGQEKRLILPQVLVLFILIIVNLFLIPKLKTAGAAISFLIGESFLAVAYWQIDRSVRDY